MSELVEISVKPAYRLQGHLLVVSVPLNREPKDSINDGLNRLAGNQYHQELERARPLEPGLLLYAKQCEEHQLDFQDVLFVVDDAQTPLRDLISNALIFADDKLEASRVILPLFWTVIDMTMRGAGRTPDDLVEEVIRGLTTFGTQCTPDFEVILSVEDLGLARKFPEPLKRLNAGIADLWTR